MNGALALVAALGVTFAAVAIGLLASNILAVVGRRIMGRSGR